ncbi:hypothetical protein ACEWQ7_004754 [Salmonella enterica]|nr:hypothetical protein [Salmonella enterica]EBL5541362.1 hypothetical protein [Salmonella enterica subsp. enterica serovar Newport]EBP8539698.1 hypothetical protein [Salmonella enterica]EDM0874546.1 hypothetical protein [Salmonella enterica]EEN2685543.1 hypothetical protein [Salmonella enterica]
MFFVKNPVNKQEKDIISLTNDFDEENEERSERRKIWIMLIILLPIIPIIICCKLLFDDLIEKSKMPGPFFSNISECIQSGNDKSKCIKAWRNSLKPFFLNYNYPQNLLKREVSVYGNELHFKKQGFLSEFLNYIRGLINKWMPVKSKVLKKEPVVKKENDCKTQSFPYDFYDYFSSLTEKGLPVTYKLLNNECFRSIEKKSPLIKTPYRNIYSLDISMQKSIANNWFDLGRAFYQSNSTDKAITAWLILSENFSYSTMPDLQDKIAEVWFNLGTIYFEMNRPSESIYYWRILTDRYRDTSNPKIKALVAKSWINLGQTYLYLSNNNEEWSLSSKERNDSH